MSKEKLLLLAGPTAVGKTALSIGLAKRLHGGIISADSVQVYRRMDIGSAKIREEERQGIRHDLIDCLEPSEEFHVAWFCEMAKASAADMRKKGLLPIVVGGTGFYIQALLKDIPFHESPGKSGARTLLEKQAESLGAEALHERLRLLDPEAAAAIHPNNVKRVIRAIEYAETSGEKISAHNERERLRTSPYDYLYFVITDTRERLYERINARVEKMIEDGLVDEVRSLVAEGLDESNLSMKALGYRQLLPYLRGELTLDEAVKRIQTETRHFAKRQLTWFKREPNVIWVDRSAFDDDEERMLDYMTDCWEKREEV